jgi:hypothetical protein
MFDLRLYTIKRNNNRKAPPRISKEIQLKSIGSENTLKHPRRSIISISGKNFPDIIYGQIINKIHDTKTIFELQVRVPIKGASSLDVDLIAINYPL